MSHVVRVIAYLRQSDEEGHKREMSIPFQEATFLSWVERAEALGQEVEYEVFKDEGRSGADWLRPGLRKLLGKLAETDVLWAYDLNRLVRHEDYNDILRELRKHNVRLTTAEGELDIHSPGGKLTTSIRMQFGAYEREVIQDRTAKNRDHRVKTGYWSNHAPIGYAFDSENGYGSRRILVPSDEAWKIKEMFRRLAEGETQHSISAILDLPISSIVYQRRNPLYAGFVWKNKRKVEELEDFSYENLRRLAEDPDYEYVSPGKHEALIDPALWDKVQQRWRKHHKASRAQRRVSSLSGVIRCGYCGRMMRLTKRANRERSLRCERCGWMKQYRFVEDTVLAAIYRFFENRKEFDRAAEQLIGMREADDPEKNERLGELRREKEQVSKRASSGMDLMLKFPDLAERWVDKVREADAREKLLEGEINKMIQEMTRPAKVMTSFRAGLEWVLSRPVREAWSKATDNENRQMLLDLFSTITADKQGMHFQLQTLGLDMEVEYLAPPLTGVCSTLVAGPGLEPGTP